MKQIQLGTTGLNVSSVVAGCMRMAACDEAATDTFVSECMELGVNFFDHADIYGGGRSESLFGTVLKKHPEYREQMFLQSKCGIVPGVMYDLSKEHILKSVDGILERLQTDHLDALLLHRPDALVEPEEVASAFDTLQQSGKVQYFGVSNMNPAQIELLKKYVKQPLVANQLQFSIPVSNLVASGIEVNMTSEGSFDHDGYCLDYCRLNDITIQAWSPFQKANWQGLFIGAEDYPELNQALNEIADAHHSTTTAVSAAWILRHPAHMQIVTGTTKGSRMKEIVAGSELQLSRQEWYRLYLAAKHILP